MKRGRCGTWTHDYVRNGTTTLFAALNVAAERCRRRLEEIKPGCTVRRGRKKAA
jgi:hypothetical protein